MSVPLHIVTGFLGSGKTSFLKHYLNQFGSEKKLAIIQNEFSPVNIDGRELHHSGDYKILEINNGSVFCVCLLGAFIGSLIKFVDEVKPDEIIMEASGMSDPLGIGQVFQSEQLRGKVYLGHVWTVIDASNYFRAEPLRNRINHQLRVADTILVNKTDLAGDASVKVIDDVKKMNPFAHVIESSYSKVDLTVMKKSFGIFPGEEHAEDYRPAIESFVIKSNREISLNQLKKFVYKLSPKLIRSKGFVKIKDSKPVFVQGVYDDFTFSETLDYSGSTELVMIGHLTSNENLQIRFDEFCQS